MQGPSSLEQMFSFVDKHSHLVVVLYLESKMKWLIDGCSKKSESMIFRLKTLVCEHQVIIYYYYYSMQRTIQPVLLQILRNILFEKGFKTTNRAGAEPMLHIKPAGSWRRLH